MHPAFRVHSAFDFDKGTCHCMCAVCELKSPISEGTLHFILQRYTLLVHPILHHFSIQSLLSNSELQLLSHL